MIKWLNRNIYFIGIALILSLVCFFFYIENELAPSILSAILIMIILSIFVITNKKIAIYSIIALAPISISLYVEFLSLKMSFPTEFITLLLIITAGSMLFINEKFDKQILFHPLSILLFLDLLITLYSSAFSTMPLISFKRLLLKMGYISAYYFIFAHYFSKPNQSKGIIYFLYAGGLIYPIYNTLKWHAFQDFSVAASFAMPQPFYSDHTVYGACLAFVLPFLISWIINIKDAKKRIKFLVIIVTATIIVAEILAYSRAAWISLLIILLFRLLLRVKIKISHIVVSVLILSSALIVNFEPLYESIRNQEIQKEEEVDVASHLGTVTNLQNDASNLERINRWSCAYRMFEERPWTGFGPGTYQFQYGQFQSVDMMTRISTHEGDRGHAHSEYFTYLSEYGLFGFIVFLITIFYSIHIGLKSYYFFGDNTRDRTIIFGALAGLITFYAHGLFNGFIDKEKMAVLVYASLMILVLYDIKRKKLNAQNE